MQKYAQIVTEHAENMVKKWSNPGSKRYSERQINRPYRQRHIDKGPPAAGEGGVLQYLLFRQLSIIIPPLYTL